LLRPALEAFIESERQQLLKDLVAAVCLTERSTLKESRLAGKIEAHEGLLSQLEKFAVEQLAQAQGVNVRPPSFQELRELTNKF
jgi:hypothetical protein